MADDLRAVARIIEREGLPAVIDGAVHEGTEAALPVCHGACGMNGGRVNSLHNGELASPLPMPLEFFSLTDTSRARANNEDSVAQDADAGLAVLADGMGGYAAGEVAAGMATSFIVSELGPLAQGNPGPGQRR